MPWCLLTPSAQETLLLDVSVDRLCSWCAESSAQLPGARATHQRVMNAKSASTWSGRVLGRENLEDYTRWLHELRDYVFSHGSLCGELMDHHLIGEPVVPGVPEVPGGPAAPEDVSQQVIGIDAGTRRQIHSCKSYEEDHQITASESYASRGIMCGDMPMRLATMSQTQVQRFFKDIETQNALYWRREHFLWELLSHATSGARKAQHSDLVERGSQAPQPMPRPHASVASRGQSRAHRYDPA